MLNLSKRCIFSHRCRIEAFEQRTHGSCVCFDSFSLLRPHLWATFSPVFPLCN